MSTTTKTVVLPKAKSDLISEPLNLIVIACDTPHEALPREQQDALADEFVIAMQNTLPAYLYQAIKKRMQQS